MNVNQLLPKEQKELIIKALESYQHTLGLTMDRHERMGNTINDSINHDVFDLTGLIGMMKYDVEIALPKEVKQKFANLHGVDFPEYGETIDRDYPIEKDEWVTVIAGTISFTDDGSHVREASIQNVVSVQKHLRSQVDEYINDIDEDGYNYLIIEDYDGDLDIVIPTPKDDRLFQSVDTINDITYNLPFKTFIDEGGYDSHYRGLIDKLSLGETLEVHSGEIYVIRIK